MVKRPDPHNKERFGVLVKSLRKQSSMLRRYASLLNGQQGQGLQQIGHAIDDLLKDFQNIHDLAYEMGYVEDADTRVGSRSRFGSRFDRTA